MSDTNCPYCDAEIKINHDDGQGYEEGYPHEQHCRECDKYFIFYTHVSFSYYPQKADCLNGGEHSYKETVTFPKEFSRLRCVDCGHEKPLKKVKIDE